MGFSPEWRVRDCGYCGLRHALMTSVADSVKAQTLDRRIRTYTILICPECAGATVIQHTPVNTSNNEIIAVGPPTQSEIDRVKHLPEDVDRYFSDAKRAMSADIPDAAAVQLRRTLEAAAKHRDIEERNLMKSIQKLIDDGHVTSSFGEALHHIRVIGNQGAHAGDDRVNTQQAEQAYRFTTQLLRNLFEVPGELAKMAAETADPDA